MQEYSRCWAVISYSAHYKNFNHLGHLYGLEKFWAFLKYYKGHQPLDISPELTKRLSKFKTLEDFRVAAAADVGFLTQSFYYNHKIYCLQVPREQPKLLITSEQDKD